MDEFNDLLSKHELTEEQLTLCREIRRRGKNKVCTIVHTAKQGVIKSITALATYKGGHKNYFLGHISKIQVFQRGVLEFAPLCNEQQIESEYVLTRADLAIM